jgi:hypothetical protein
MQKILPDVSFLAQWKDKIEAVSSSSSSGRVGSVTPVMSAATDQELHGCVYSAAVSVKTQLLIYCAASL